MALISSIYKNLLLDLGVISIAVGLVVVDVAAVSWVAATDNIISLDL
jgi:hypothetical protein